MQQQKFLCWMSVCATDPGSVLLCIILLYMSVRFNF